MICIVYVKLSRRVCNIVNRKYCLYNVLLLSLVHPYPVVMILVKCKRIRRISQLRFRVEVTETCLSESS